MFEDALVESSGKLRSQSRLWMLATFALNMSIIAALILLPLLHPAALPRTAMLATLIAPPPPPAPKTAPVKAVLQARAAAPLSPMVAPARVPHTVNRTTEAPPPDSILGMQHGTMTASTGPAGDLLSSMRAGSPVVIAKAPDKPKDAGPVRVSSGVAAGSLLDRTTPAYPPIAKAAHVSGAVLLHAVISKAGTIESLQVLAGPEMLRASALDAVRQWRYRPYLLNGEPTEVETTITVNFTFGG